MSTLKVQIGAELRELENALSRVSRSVEDLGKRMSSMGATLSKRVTAPLVGFGALALRTAGDFESSMNRVGAISQATAGEMQGLESAARQLGATTQFSASQAADAMSFLAMAGFEVNEITSAMPSVLNLAAAAQLDMASAADIASNIMSGFNMTAGELEGAVDVLAKSFTSANTDLSQLGEAMKMVGPVASGFGIQFEETAAAVGFLSDAGIQASSAGTGLRRIMTQLAQNADELGISVFDAAGNMRPLADMIEDIEKVGLSSARAMEIFGDRGGPAMQVLLSRGSDALREMTGELGDAGGTAQRIADQQMQGLNGALQRLRSAFEELQIAIANSGLLDMATNLIGRITELTQRLSNLNPDILKLGVLIAGAAAAIGPLLFIIGKLTAAIGSASLIVGKLTAAIAFLTSPIGMVIVAIAALSAAILYIWVNWSAIVERISDWSWWKNMLIDMIQFFLDQNPFEHIIKAYNFLLRRMGRDEIQSPFQGMIDSLEALKDDTQQYEHQFSSMADTIQTATDKAKESISGLFSTGGAADFAEGTEESLDRVGLAYETAADRVQNAIARMKFSTVEGGKGMTEGLGEVYETVQGIGPALETTITSAATSFAESFGRMIASAGDGQEFFGNLVKMLADFASQLGRIVIGIGTAMLALQPGNIFSNPWMAIAAGGALVALGAALRSAISSGPGGSGSGGGSSAFQPSARSVPEAGGSVTFKIGNNELVGVLQQGNSIDNRIGRIRNV